MIEDETMKKIMAARLDKAERREHKQISDAINFRYCVFTIKSEVDYEACDYSSSLHFLTRAATLRPALHAAISSNQHDWYIVDFIEGGIILDSEKYYNNLDVYWKID